MKYRVILVLSVIFIIIIWGILALKPLEERFIMAVEKIQGTESIIVKTSAEKALEYYETKRIEDDKIIADIVNIIASGKPHTNIVVGLEADYQLEFYDKNNDILFQTYFPGISLYGMDVVLEKESTNKIMQYITSD